MQRTFNIFLLFVGLMHIISCSKDNDGTSYAPLPDTVDYFFVRMNGQPWQPDPNYNWIGCSIGYLQSGQRHLLIDPVIDTIGIYLSVMDNGLGEQFYFPITYTDTTSSFLFNYGIVLETDSGIDYASSMINGHLTITGQDISSNKISGNFEFTVVDTSNGSNDTIHFTEGRFVNLIYSY